MKNSGNSNQVKQVKITQAVVNIGNKQIELINVGKSPALFCIDKYGNINPLSGDGKIVFWHAKSLKKLPLGNYAFSGTQKINPKNRCEFFCPDEIEVI